MTGRFPVHVLSLTIHVARTLCHMVVCVLCWIGWCKKFHDHANACPENTNSTKNCEMEKWQWHALCTYRKCDWIAKRKLQTKIQEKKKRRQMPEKRRKHKIAIHMRMWPLNGILRWHRYISSPVTVACIDGIHLHTRIAHALPSNRTQKERRIKMKRKTKRKRKHDTKWNTS